MSKLTSAVGCVEQYKDELESDRPLVAGSDAALEYDVRLHDVAQIFGNLVLDKVTPQAGWLFTLIPTGLTVPSRWNDEQWPVFYQPRQRGSGLAAEFGLCLAAPDERVDAEHIEFLLDSDNSIPLVDREISMWATPTQQRFTELRQFRRQLLDMMQYVSSETSD